MFYIKQLKLLNFRCHRMKELSFLPKVNIIKGKNASGKTSVVEAIHCLGFGKSYKTNSNVEMISIGVENSVIQADITKNNKADNILLVITPNGKTIERNNKPYPRLSDYLGYFNVVVFSQEDYRIIKGTPRERRGFLDLNISQFSLEYLNSLINYRKILKQRNEMLKMIAEKQSRDYILLKTLTEQLIKVGKVIIHERKRFVAQINPLLTLKTKQISLGKEEGMILYTPNTEAEELERTFLKKEASEIMMQTTLFGPHRDDFQIIVNNQKAEAYASQGQQRTLLLAAKLALTDLLGEKETPLIVILDDVFSELDNNRQNQILEMINNKYQIFITTTNIEGFSQKLLERSHIINIEEEETL